MKKGKAGGGRSTEIQSRVRMSPQKGNLVQISEPKKSEEGAT